MSILKRSLTPLLLSAAIALPIAGSQAQQQPPAPPGPPPVQRQLPSPDVTGRMLEGRIAMIKATLKLNEAQAKLFAPIEEQMRANHAARDKMMRERFEKAKANPQARFERPALTERLDMMAAHADRLKAFVAAFKPFHASLSDEQKAVVEPLFRQMVGMGRRHDGHRHGMHRFGGRFQGPERQ
jgi:hypothetical protein